MRVTSSKSNDYYPYGLPMPSSSDYQGNDYKYGGKEFDMFQKVNIYDFAARTYIPDEGRFWQPDNPQSVETTNGLEANAIINLAHELAHTKYSWDGGKNDIWFVTLDEASEPHKVKISNIYTTHVENRIRSQGNRIKIWGGYCKRLYQVAILTMHDVLIKS